MGLTYRESRSYDIEPKRCSPPTCKYRARIATRRRTESCRTCSNPCLTTRDRDLVNMFAQACGLSFWIVDAVCVRCRRPAYFSDQQHGDAHPEPEGRSP